MVLVVEGEAFGWQTWAEFLIYAGIEVESAADGERSLPALGEQIFSISL